MLMMPMLTKVTVIKIPQHSAVLLRMTQKTLDSLSQRLVNTIGSKTAEIVEL